MKKIENHVDVLVRLSSVGSSVVLAKVDSSFRLCPLDSAFVAGAVLDALLPDYLRWRSLYDGSFIVTPCNDEDDASRLSVPSGASVIAFDADVELNDGRCRAVHFKLDKSNEPRRDYIVRDVRTIVLRGVVSVEVDDDEHFEE